jgi:hypothetical protein
MTDLRALLQEVRACIDALWEMRHTTSGPELPADNLPMATVQRFQELRRNIDAALAEPAPEPVAMVRRHTNGVPYIDWSEEKWRYSDLSELVGCGLYAGAPPPPSPDIARDAARYRELSTPEINDFILAIEREALHQRDRWGSDHDARKTDSDWFWLIGYVAGKALHKPEKRLHHIITTAAVCLNWHAHAIEMFTKMRPGIDAAIEREGGA